MKRTVLFITLLAAMAGMAALNPTATAQPAKGSFTQTWQKGPEWLQNAVIYQVYPSSYKDSDGNGIGDIPGVISKLDYISSLGVTAIWFNPLFASGWIDGGYDVIDFYRVDPRFGTNNDLVELIDKAHARGIKVMLDLVAGHTSDKHPWFLQSAQDSNLQYSDYFIWSDRLPDKKAEKDLETMLKDPNFMQSTTGKWMKSDFPRAKYYYKNFYACQPALNYGYANPDPNHPWEQSVDAPGPKAVRQELKDILAFWYGKGVDGFRVDMAASLVKNDRDKKEILRLWREMREWSDANYPGRVLMAEWNDPKYCLASGFNVDMNLNSTRSANRRMYFDTKHQADGGSYFSLNGGAPSERDLYGNPWPEDRIDRTTTPSAMLKRYYDYITDVYDWTRDWGYFATITGNHDHLRFNTGARNDPSQLKVMMAWVLTMPLPILYYGDEIGIRSLVELPNVEGANHNGKERAGGRSPMQWDSSANAGFSTCAPENIYIPVCPEWTPATSYPQYLEWKAAGCKNPTAPGAITVEAQDKDPESLLNWTRALISLRKSTPAFWADARFEPRFDEAHPYPMVYTRTDGKESYLIALNPTSKKQTLTLDANHPAAEPVMCFGKAVYKPSKKGDRLTLPPVSALIVRIN
ncbi:MAG: alpha-glucosidase C-terminal domain-containing protein [Bacteroidales bacterium]|nr:alpha-glucosidase C-terminal domain-containing protein [Bacteroidales bacterium]